MADIRVIRGVTDFAGSEGVDDVFVAFPEEPDPDRTFVRVTNVVPVVCGGDPAGTDASAAIGQFAVRADLQQDGGVWKLRLLKNALGQNDLRRVYWEAWEYTGEVGGANEFIVREHGSATVALGTTIVTPVWPAAAVTPADCVVFIAGFEHTDTQTAAAPGFDREMWRVDMVLGTPDYTLERQATNTQGDLGWEFVEFVGSNWTVEYLEHTFTAAATTETESIASVGSWANAFVVWSHEAERGAPQDSGVLVWPGVSTTQVRFRIASGADVTADNRVSAFVLQNPDMSVQHFDTITGGETQLPSKVNPGPHVDTFNVAQVSPAFSSAWAGAIQTNSGDYPYGWYNYRLLDDGLQVEFWIARGSPNAADFALQVISLPLGPITPTLQPITIAAPVPFIEINVFKVDAAVVGVAAPTPGIVIGAFFDTTDTDTGPSSDPPVAGLEGLGVGGLKLVDVKLVLANDIADLALENGDLVHEVTLTTAVIVSLWTDRRAEDGDELPRVGDDPRGWWGEDAAAPIGSRLWLLSRGKKTAETSLAAVEYCAQALEWIRELDIASRVVIDAEFDAAGRLCIEIEIERGDATRFPGLWDGAKGAKEFNAENVTLRLLTG